MPPSDDNRLIYWFFLIKDEWLPSQRRRLGEWFTACRAEPSLIWQTPQVRYSVYGLGGLAAVLCVITLVHTITPPPPANARPRATTATFHVVCSEPECDHHFMVERKFSFKKFPLQCPKCQKQTGQSAMRCFSETCKGKYVLPKERDGKRYCSECSAAAPVAG